FCSCASPPPPTSTRFPYTTLFRSITDDLVAMAQDQAVALTPDRSIIGLDTNDVAVANRGRSVFDHRPTASIYTTATIMDQEQFRSEEHTSELQSRFDLVCRLLLEK